MRYTLLHRSEQSGAKTLSSERQVTKNEGDGGWSVRGGGGVGGGGGGGWRKWRGTDQKLGVGQVGVGPAPSLEPHSPWRS